jgi:hypothetical protein
MILRASGQRRFPGAPLPCFRPRFDRQEFPSPNEVRSLVLRRSGNRRQQKCTANKEHTLHTIVLRLWSLQAVIG